MAGGSSFAILASCRGHETETGDGRNTQYARDSLGRGWLAPDNLPSDYRGGGAKPARAGWTGLGV
jgi:hypothetical protein